MIQEATTYRFNVEKYFKLGETGIFDEDDRVELLEGEIVIMSPIGKRHATAVRRLIRTFSRKVADRCLVDCQNPDILDRYLLLRLEIERAVKVPEPSDILLIVEVADSSLGYDRGAKLRSYAMAGIPEVWIVNLLDDVVECYRDPANARYGSTQNFRPGESLSVAAFPHVSFGVDELLP